MSMRTFEIASILLALGFVAAAMLAKAPDTAPTTEHRFVSVAPAGATEGNVHDLTY